MLKKFVTPVVAMLAAFGAIATAQTTQPSVETARTLLVGSTAPALSVAQWYKGAPVTSFVPGRVYVVEFWATWCGPCKKNIPHLTALQKEYAGQVTIIGVDVWEHPEDETDAAIVDTVKPFVARMGDEMDYTVAGDGIDKTMTTTWMDAAGQGAIPTAFVIGRDGKIEWIGIASDMAPVLKAVTAGTWDRTAEAKRAELARIADTRRTAELKALFAARKANDPTAMQAAFDTMCADNPGLKDGGDGISMQLEIDLMTDPAKAIAYAQQLTAPSGAVAAKPVFVWSILRILPEKPTAAVTVDTLKAFSAVCEPIVAAGKADQSPVYLSFARLQDNVGKPADAVRYQEKGLAKIEAFRKTAKPMPADDKFTRRKKRISRPIASTRKSRPEYLAPVTPALTSVSP